MFNCITCNDLEPLGARFPGGRCVACYVDFVHDLVANDPVRVVATPWRPL